MRTLFLCIALLATSALDAQKTVKTKQKLVMQVSAGTGTNGAGVAWNPGKMMYYTAFAGNASFPLTTFNSKGKVVDATMETGFDVRGFWFNSTNGKIEGTAYQSGEENDEYIYSHTIASTGIPNENTSSTQLDKFSDAFDQNRGVFNATDNELLFQDGNGVFRFNATTGEFIGKKELKSDLNWENINPYSLVYTGRKGEEYAVFNYVTKQIYLFDASTGKNSKIVKLPSKAPAPDRFNFSYANGMFWVFNTVNRQWHAYTHP